MENIKFIDLSMPQNIQSELSSAYDRVFRSSNYIGGVEVEAFENEWAEYCEAKYCIGVGNGFDALVLACGYMAEEYKPIKPGMIVPWKTCKPSWISCRASCSPMPDTFNEKLKMAVHIYGQITLPDNYEKDYLVEDCAQAHGAKFNGTKAGKFGKVAAWSFYPTKNLGALGDAGAITTDDEAIYEYARDLRNYGGRNDHGINSRLDPLQAAFLRVKLKYLDGWNERRRNNAMAYYQNIFVPDLQLPFLGFYDRPNWHIFAIETDRRDSLRKYLLDNGVETLIHYPEVPYPTHWHVAQAERWTKRTLSLPIAPHVTSHLCKRIAELINRWGDDND